MLHDGGDMRAEVLRDLHAADADRAGGAVDEDRLAALDPRGAQQRHRAQPAVRDGGGLLEASIRRGCGAIAPSARTHTYSALRPRADAEDAVAGARILDGGADSLDLARELHPACAASAGGAVEEPADEVLHARAPGIAPERGRRAHADEDLVLLRHGPLDVASRRTSGGP